MASSPATSRSSRSRSRADRAGRSAAASAVRAFVADGLDDRLGRVDPGAGRYVLTDQGVRADPGVVSNVDRSEDGGTDAEHDAVADGRVAPGTLRVAPPTATTEVHPVVHGDVVADHRRL